MSAEQSVHDHPASTGMVLDDDSGFAVQRVPGAFSGSALTAVGVWNFVS
ncbi:MAG: hypothetical protein WA724_11045 [Candidatus Dormiibacterota bacterium]